MLTVPVCWAPGTLRPPFYGQVSQVWRKGWLPSGSQWPRVVILALALTICGDLCFLELDGWDQVDQQLNSGCPLG